MKNKYRIFQSCIILTCVLFTILSGCQKNDSESPIVAQVGESVLDIEKIKHEMPLDKRIDISEEAVSKYVQRWIERELLYQEGLRVGLQNDSSIVRRLKSLERDLVIDLLLDKMIEDRISVSADEIKDYYSEHSFEYLFGENEYRLEHLQIRRSTRIAREVENYLKNNNTFKDFPSKDIEYEELIIPDPGVFIYESDLPDTLRKEVVNLKVGESTKRIIFQNKYNFLILAEKREEDTQIPLELIQEEIRENVIVEKRYWMYIELIDKLRERVNIELDLELLDFLYREIEDKDEIG